MAIENKQCLDVSAVVKGYLESALWSSNDEHGEPLNAVFSLDDVDRDSYEAARSDCEDFVSSNQLLLHDLSAQIVGVDFWLTRNGHGGGFWDRGLGLRGTELTQLAKAYGSCDAYVGDDQKIYLN